MKRLFFCIIILFTCLQGFGQLKVKWAYAIKSNDTLLQGPSAADETGNVYTCGTFIGTLIVGTDTLVAVPNASMFLLKLDSIGVPVWARKLPISDITQNMFTLSLHRIKTRNGRVCVMGSVYNQQSGINRGYLASFEGGNGAAIGYNDNTTLAYIDADFDQAKNLYVTGGFIGNSTYPSSHFLMRFNSSGNLAWQYYAPDTTLIGGLRYDNGNVTIVGQYLTKLQISDSFNTTPIHLNAIGGIGSWNIFTATYNINGVLQSGSGMASIPTAVGLVPDFSSAMAHNGAWCLVWSKVDAWGNVDLNFRKVGIGFSTNTVLLPPNKMTCPFAPVTSVFLNQYAPKGVLSAAGLSCGVNSFKIDSTGKVYDTLIGIPAVATFANTIVRDFTFDSAGSTFLTSNLIGAFQYRDSIATKTASSSKDAGFVAKLHECINYAVSIIKTNDTLRAAPVISGLKTEWYNNGILVGTDTMHIPTTTGNYTVKLVDKWNCISASTPLYVPLTINDQYLAGISIVPNPVLKTFKVSGLKRMENIEVINSIGIVSFSQRADANTDINISHLPNGLYIVRIGASAIKLLKSN